MHHSIQLGGQDELWVFIVLRFGSWNAKHGRRGVTYPFSLCTQKNFAVSVLHVANIFFITLCDTISSRMPRRVDVEILSFPAVIFLEALY